MQGWLDLMVWVGLPRVFGLGAGQDRSSIRA